MLVVFSARSREDIFEIGAYIAQDNPARALGFMDELEAKANSLAEMPRKGAPRETLSIGLRILTHGNYVIYYKLIDDRVRILRVLHGARDIGGDDLG